MPGDDRKQVAATVNALARRRGLILLARASTRWAILGMVLLLLSRLAIGASGASAPHLTPRGPGDLAACAGALVVLAMILGLLKTLLSRRPRKTDLAWFADTRLGLCGEFATGVEMLSRECPTDLERSLVTRAGGHSRKALARTVFPAKAQGQQLTFLMLFFLYVLISNLPVQDFAISPLQPSQAISKLPTSSAMSRDRENPSHSPSEAKAGQRDKAENHGKTAESAQPPRPAGREEPGRSGASRLFGPPERTPITKRPRFVKPLFGEGSTVLKEVAPPSDSEPQTAPYRAESETPPPLPWNDELMAKYRRIAEATVEREPIPPPKKELVRRYFNLLRSEDESPP